MKIIPENFKPESMLINQYLPGESLGLHQDRSEKNLDAPIISISLGSPGIFLLGGSKRNDAIEEIVLNPGDVFVMSGVCRMKFHGFRGITRGTKRVNLTIRQVY
jgi:alkylated DNA repair protein (DNA oxidative demethylase)